MESAAELTCCSVSDTASERHTLINRLFSRDHRPLIGFTRTDGRIHFEKICFFFFKNKHLGKQTVN